MKISVILCAHNPRLDYISKTAKGLLSQVQLDEEDWELIVVDNASDTPIQTLEVQWPSNTRFVDESELGLTAARIRGIKESKSELLLFVDDDNILDSDYLIKGLEVGEDFLMLGAWGGSSIGVYEEKPEHWFFKYSSYVGVREIACDLWGNEYYKYAITPIGAGMFVRKFVANQYLKCLNEDRLRSRLDRMGNSLISGGDNDLANTALDMGLGMGVFSRLRLQHLINKGRLQHDYLCRLARGIGASQVVLRKFRPGKGDMVGSNRPISAKLIDFIRDIRSCKEARLLRRNLRKGWEEGQKIIDSNNL